jgi:hypothetical protein
MLILETKHVPDLLVRKRCLELVHLPRDLDVRVIPLQNFAGGFDGSDEGVCGVEDLQSDRSGNYQSETTEVERHCMTYLETQSTLLNSLIEDLPEISCIDI